MSLLERELQSLRNSPTCLSLYIEGIQLLQQSGIVQFLRLFSRPVIYKNGIDIAVNATEAARSAGFNDCLDCLLMFQEAFLRKPDEVSPDLRMDFNGLERAKARNDLTEEEANAIRSGKSPDYSKYLSGSKPTTPIA